ncbi:cytochrome c biogenesis protein CcsA [Chitinophaga horti]|uniref:Cytochrome c biogenesis protein CcsA n=1 Tax=Chitinophaga horti TaxID=2920382 RepID=A0ABY6J505_9BACT|nr:cytochrome c biogenesis protein CcsA [Chitinophaga horti]UYQ94758.1 cytochrome c biogenesis protein CcsA [Chitinophaga horti]
METKFVGEHLLPGQLGHFFAVLAFVASILATVAYACAVTVKDPLRSDSWRKLGRWSFYVQTASVLLVFGILYYIISNHLFEYKYAFQHSSRSLPMNYLLACFWEGQEGSFLLWSFWHSLLGLVLIHTTKKWEAPVMTVLSLAQICLGSMLLGIYIFDYHVGSNPFILMREENVNAPIFQSANYMEMDFMKDGNGLNILLQNYWMVIHPPVLFLGFACTIIPFAFAFGGLWTKDFSGWIKPALPWALFGTMMLGTGIMMGAAWAYESLTFGGYWAWDPVENASLVPWLTLVAGIHTLLAYKHSGHALKSTFFFFIISFVLILYSTFLTRSGILGQTSVHAFTDLGMSGQLLIFMGIFTIPALWLLIRYNKLIPSPKKEESSYSREFWLFVGSLVLLVSAIQITYATSIPVWAKIPWFKNLAPPTEPEFYYNKIQIWVAIVIGLLTGLIQYLKWKDTAKGTVLKKIWVPLAITLAATVAIIVFGKVNYSKYGAGFLVAIYLMLFSSIFAIVGNFSYIFIGIKGNLKAAGASVAHIGFGMVLLGVLISSSKMQVLSLDKAGILDGYFTEESKQNSRENLMLPKGMPMQMGDYYVTYAGDSSALGDPKSYYIVRYERKANRDAPVTERFTLYPDAFMNAKGQEGTITPNPASKHYLTKDIFTYVTGLPDKQHKKEAAAFKPYKLKDGDTVFFSQGYLVMRGLENNPVKAGYTPQPGDITVAAKLDVFTKTDKKYELSPLFVLRGTEVHQVEDSIAPLALNVQFAKILPEEKQIELMIREVDNSDDYIVLRALVFPFINVLWIGIIVMIAGFLMSMYYRIKKR